MQALRTTLAVAVLLTASSAFAQNHSGTLEAGDQTLDDTGEYMDAYTFEAAEGQQITVTMTASSEADGLDTYLIVQSPSGQKINNDDAGPGMSKVETVATEGGTWTAIATSYSSGETGAYELQIELGAIADVEVTEGRLDASDSVGIKGEYYDTHSISVPAGKQFSIELASLGFDGYLSVTAPSGQKWRNDDAGSTEISRVGPLTAENGEYTVYVTSNSAEEVGAYDLRILTFN